MGNTLRCCDATAPIVSSLNDERPEKISEIDHTRTPMAHSESQDAVKQSSGHQRHKSIRPEGNSTMKKVRVQQIESFEPMILLSASAGHVNCTDIAEYESDTSCVDIVTDCDHGKIWSAPTSEAHCGLGLFGLFANSHGHHEFLTHDVAHCDAAAETQNSFETCDEPSYTNDEPIYVDEPEYVDEPACADDERVYVDEPVYVDDERVYADGEPTYADCESADNDLYGGKEQACDSNDKNSRDDDSYGHSLFGGKSIVGKLFGSKAKDCDSNDNESKNKDSYGHRPFDGKSSIGKLFGGKSKDCDSNDHESKDKDSYGHRPFGGKSSIGKLFGGKSKDCDSNDHETKDKDSYGHSLSGGKSIVGKLFGSKASYGRSIFSGLKKC